MCSNTHAIAMAVRTIPWMLNGVDAILVEAIDLPEFARLKEGQIEFERYEEGDHGPPCNAKRSMSENG